MYSVRCSRRARLGSLTGARAGGRVRPCDEELLHTGGGGRWAACDLTSASGRTPGKQGSAARTAGGTAQASKPRRAAPSPGPGAAPIGMQHLILTPLRLGGSEEGALRQLATQTPALRDCPPFLGAPRVHAAQQGVAKIAAHLLGTVGGGARASGRRQGRRLPVCRVCTRLWRALLCRPRAHWRHLLAVRPVCQSTVIMQSSMQMQRRAVGAKGAAAPAARGLPRLTRRSAPVRAQAAAVAPATVDEAQILRCVNAIRFLAIDGEGRRAGARPGPQPRPRAPRRPP